MDPQSLNEISTDTFFGGNQLVLYDCVITHDCATLHFDLCRGPGLISGIDM